MRMVKVANTLRLVALLSLASSAYFILRAVLDLHPAQRAGVGDSSDFTPLQNPVGFLTTLDIHVTSSLSIRWWVVMATIAGFSAACWAASLLLRRRRVHQVAA